MSTKRPLYAQLASLLSQEIRSGKYSVGSLIPTELEISKLHKVSRSTARSALNELVSLGLIARKKGIGTRVLTASPILEYSPSATSIEDLINYDASTIRKVINIEDFISDEINAKRLGEKPGQRWTCLSILRCDVSKNQTPLCFNENYISYEFANVTEGIANYPGLIVHKIRDEYGVNVKEIRQSIKAIGLSEDVAKYLKSSPGDYALEIKRNYYDISGTTLLIAISIHPSNIFTYTSTIKLPSNTHR